MAAFVLNDKLSSQRLKVAILADANSTHTQHWVVGLQERGYETHLISADPFDGKCFCDSLHILRFRPKMGYVFNAFNLRILLNRLKPDIVHVHYASGYGTLIRLSGYKPYILSVWGSDVFEYPDRSPFCLKCLRNNLQRADIICSTSNVMAQRTKRLLPTLDTIHVTPFGIDTDIFKPSSSQNEFSNFITVGTVKTLSSPYGIDILLRAFLLAKQRIADDDPSLADRLQLRITGSGPDEAALKSLANQLGIDALTQFVGRIPHENVTEELNCLDVYVAVSRCEESFGVAVLEASACEVPVIVSNKGGLPEVVINGETGLIVPAEDIERTADAIIQLVTNPQRRKEMGEAGRRFVQYKYDWQVSMDIMEDVYRKYLKRYR